MRKLFDLCVDISEKVKRLSDESEGKKLVMDEGNAKLVLISHDIALPLESKDDLIKVESLLGKDSAFKEAMVSFPI